MNIFVLSHNRTLAAAWLDDKRANKMVVESLQLLSTTINVIEGKQYDGVYASFNPNHPCRLWVGQSQANFFWLLRYTLGLVGNRCKPEVHLRARGVLAATYHWYRDNKHTLPGDIGDKINFVNCAGNESKGISFKDDPHTIAAYRKYLCARWPTDTRPPTWNTGVKPYWYQ